MCNMFSLLKVVSYNDLTILSMSVMGFQKKFGWGVGVLGELYPVVFWIFFNVTKSLSLLSEILQTGGSSCLLVLCYNW